MHVGLYCCILHGGWSPQRPKEEVCLNRAFLQLLHQGAKSVTEGFWCCLIIKCNHGLSNLWRASLSAGTMANGQMCASLFIAHQEISSIGSDINKANTALQKWCTHGLTSLHHSSAGTCPNAHRPMLASSHSPLTGSPQQTRRSPSWGPNSSFVGTGTWRAQHNDEFLVCS